MAAVAISEDRFDNLLNIRASRLSSKLQLISQRRVLRPAGVQLMNWRIMVNLHRLGHSHLSQITKKTSLDPAHASRAVSQMERDGLVARRVDGRDNRRRELSLTPKGREIVDRLWPQIEAIGNEVRTSFNDDEFNALKLMMDRAIAKVDAMLIEDDSDRDGDMNKPEAA